MSSDLNNVIFYPYKKVWECSCQSLYKDPQSWLFAIHPEDSFKAIASN